MHMRMRLLTGLWAAAFAVGATSLGAAPVDDATLRGRIEQRLEAAKLAGEIEISVASGQVTLDGTVATVTDQTRALHLARKETKSVESRLRVVPVTRPRAELVKAVRKAILSYAYLSVFDDVKLELSEQGDLRLLGSVRQPWRKRQLEDSVARVAGVRAIQNDIEVQPVSMFDDRLRAQLYNSIYRSGRFANYAVNPERPIRIVVAHGRITLAGVVNSRVDQVMIGMLARQTMSFGVDNQLKLDSEMEKEPAAKPKPGTPVPTIQV